MGRCLGRGNRYTRRRLFVDNHGWLRPCASAYGICRKPRLHVRLQGKMRPGVMVESGGHPALRSWQSHKCFPALGELAVMGVFMTIFANLRRVLELDFLLAGGTL